MQLKYFPGPVSAAIYVEDFTRGRQDSMKAQLHPNALYDHCMCVRIEHITILAMASAHTMVDNTIVSQPVTTFATVHTT